MTAQIFLKKIPVSKTRIFLRKRIEQNLLLVKYLRAALKRPIQNSVKNLRLSALVFNYFPKRSILDV